MKALSASSSLRLFGFRLVLRFLWLWALKGYRIEGASSSRGLVFMFVFSVCLCADTEVEIHVVPSLPEQGLYFQQTLLGPIVKQK